MPTKNVLKKINSKTQLVEQKIPTELKIPKCLKDLDVSCKNVLMYGSELDANHPGFQDESYRKRREIFTRIALKYNQEEEIPKVKYTKQEMKTWEVVFQELQNVYPTHACKRYRQNLDLMKKENLINSKTIPQLGDISKYLMKKTGFRLRPCAGYLNPRDFLSALAFKVFNCTQYIRHHSDPFYTPEPDLCHEILGHMPMLADKKFADYSQMLGIASLGASEEDVKRLASCYLYSIEFGLIKEGKTVKAYGAGLLSSKLELEHAVKSSLKHKEFCPYEVGKQDFNVTSFQSTYFVSSSIEQAQSKMKSFISKLKHEVVVNFDYEKLKVEVLNSSSREN